MVVLRAVGGGGCGCGFLGLPLVMVELGFSVAELEEQKRKGTQVATIIFCVVSVGGSIVLAKSGVKKLRYMTKFCDQTKVLEFLSDSGVWVMTYELCVLSLRYEN